MPMSLMPTPPPPAQPDKEAPEAPKIHTRHLAVEQPNGAGVQRVTGPLDQTLPWVIEMRIVGTASTLQVRVRDAMLIGRRSDNTGSPAPEIDLAPHNAFSHGVSRSHAMIVVKEQKLMLKDLGSTNGTRLNDIICEPGKEYRLRHGDEVMFGRMRLQVSFAVVPDEAAMNTPIPLRRKKETVEPIQPDTKPSVPNPPNGRSPANATATSERAATPKASGTANDARSTADAKSVSRVDIPQGLMVGKGERVLIIEDDEDVGAVFVLALQKAGYSVTLVPNVARGLAFIFQQMPDVIVVDLLLPDMNGLDLVRYVRKQKTPRRVPMLVVSSATAGYQRHQALEAGADVFLGKPLAVEELINSVAKSLKAVS